MWTETVAIFGHVLLTEHQRDSGEDRRTLLASAPKLSMPIHQRQKGVRLLIKDAVPVLGIVNPASSSSKQQSVFSRPLLVTNSLPQALLDQGIITHLLYVGAKARILKYLLESYPGGEHISAMHQKTFEPTPPMIETSDIVVIAEAPASREESLPPVSEHLQTT